MTVHEEQAVSSVYTLISPGADRPTGLTDEEWARVQTLSPLPDPPDDLSNDYDDRPAAAQLGQQFYFDTRFSGNATLVDTLGVAVPYARAALEPVRRSNAGIVVSNS